MFLFQKKKNYIAQRYPDLVIFEVKRYRRKRWIEYGFIKNEFVYYNC